MDQIALLHLRYFVAVVEEGTVRAAADRLGISQPSLSQQVTQLERRLGVRLFDRSATGMRPTDAGRRLLGIATRTLQAMNDLGAPASAVRRIGVPRGTDSGVLEILTGRFGTAIEFVALDTSRAQRALGRTVDAAVVRGPITPVREAASTVLRTTPLGVLVSSDYLLAARDEIEWADLEGMSLLWFDERRAPEYAAWLLGCCHEHGWRPRLRVLDPAGTQLVADALRRETNLVALRPQQERQMAGLSWVRLADPPEEELLLLSRAPV